MVLSLILIGLAGTPTAAEELPLPAAWHGTWAGTLSITRDKAEAEDIPMRLEVGPTDDAGRYTFRLTYGEGAKKQVRDYLLNAKAGKPGRFEIDERNGIRLDATLTGARLDTLFQVGDSLVQTRYELTKSGMKVEITAYSVREPLSTKPEKGGAEVRSYRVVGVQSAELKKLPG